MVAFPVQQVTLVSQQLGLLTLDISVSSASGYGPYSASRTLSADGGQATLRWMYY